MNTLSYRLPMPLVDVDQPFSTKEELSAALPDLQKRALWFLSTRSSAEVDEEYRDLCVSVWIETAEEGPVARYLLTDPIHARAHVPEDAVQLSLKGVWTLRQVEDKIRSGDWFVAYMNMVYAHIIDRFGDGSTD